MPGLFVTATGTDVGKTYVMSGLIGAGRRGGLAMAALKPVQSGFTAATAAASDAAMLLTALGEPVTSRSIARIAPWRFKAPLSPDMAAALEGVQIDYKPVLAACRAAIHADRLTLIEGVGGVMVPFDRRHTILDLVADLGMPVLLVSATGLGSISHCLTALAALQGRGIKPCAIVLNETSACAVPLASTLDTLSAFVGGIPLAVIPRGGDDAAFDRLLAIIANQGPSRSHRTEA